MNSKNIYIDIDNTITITNGEDYAGARPRYDRIDIINVIYEAGNTVTYWTARGTVSGIDFRELTERQLKEWGCKYHELKMGKPAFDLFIDDKAFNSQEIDDLEVVHHEGFTIEAINDVCS